MQKQEMDRSGAVIIKICIFSIVLSLTALLLCGIFQYIDGRNDIKTWEKTTLPVIIIDAGHGGNDGGAKAEDGTKEKDLNLDVALALGEMLNSGGYSVIQTRETDEMLDTGAQNGSAKMRDLKKRLEIANSAENAVFISIHMNKFFQTKYSGLQVFYSSNNTKSEQMADIIQRNTRKFLQNDNKRDTKAAGSNIYILDNIDIPAVLVECGFLSNPAECERLKNAEYRKEIAAVIYASVIEFFSEL